MTSIKRVYEPKSSDDGFRILVDRLWPRGLSKDEAAVDLWMKEIAPSDELRKWFGHDPDKWQDFKKKYEDELKSKKDMLYQLKKLEKEHGKLTILYGAHDERKNQAVVLTGVLDD